MHGAARAARGGEPHSALSEEARGRAADAAEALDRERRSFEREPDLLCDFALVAAPDAEGRG